MALKYHPSDTKIRILFADDDEDDRLMVKDALEEVRFGNAVDFVVDGQDLMDYLQRKGKYNVLQGTPLPDLLLLDLNMPRKDGYECLREIKSDPELARMPIVVLTTSSAEQDVLRSYDLGVNSFITKPVTFQKLIEVIKTLTDYWFQVVRLP